MKETARWSKLKSWTRAVDVDLWKITVWTFRLELSDRICCWVALGTCSMCILGAEYTELIRAALGEEREQDIQKETSQDAAHDIDTLLRFKVSHVLNVAYGVTNLFSDRLVYKTLQILDLPDTDITSYLKECSAFIDEAKKKSGVVLVHCNAGVSRSSSIVIGYLMLQEGLSFDDAFNQVKMARSSICPNPGFYQQLQSYKP